MRRFFLLLIIFFLHSFFSVFAQDSELDMSVLTEEAPGEEDAASVEDTDITEEEPEQEEQEIVFEEAPFYIEMDIRTSTLAELATWARDLGISDGGTREQLAARLRAHFRLTSEGAPVAEQRVIAIESAKTTEYFTIEVVGEEFARLTGDVVISLRDGNALHRVRAWEILYNRTRNVLTATGNVEYIKEEGDTTETFRGQSITVNLDDWSSIFMDGVSERSVSGNASTYRFAGTIISRSAEGATILSRAEITNPATEEPFWSLSASRLWLLPGNDWAILNAVLRVGNIPLLYLPFFYYPADQLVFHPVMGYRSREGTYLQTTTYILGRPQSVGISESSIATIFGGGDGGDLVREGIFLRSTGERVVNTSSIHLPLFFDAYVNLGFYLGTNTVIPGRGIFNSTRISAGLGLTRNIYRVGNSYTPFPEHDANSEWNRASIFSMGIPFRYRFDASGSLEIPDGSFEWKLPYYSDPYVDRDFMRRAQAQDWIGMLRDWNVPDYDTTDLLHTSFEWDFRGSYSPSFPALAPYINRISVSNFFSNLQFNERISRSYSGPTEPANPGRAFFFPSRLTLLSVSAAIAGVPYTTSRAAVTTSQTTRAGPAPGDALLPDRPIPPWGFEDEEAISTQAQIISEQDMFILSPPVLSQRFTLPSIGGPRFSFDYNLSPTVASELQFRSSPENWTEQEDISWGEVSTVLTMLRTSGSIGFNLAHPTGFFSNTLRLNGRGSWWGYTYLNENSEEFLTRGVTDPARIRTARNRAYRETFIDTNWDVSNTLRPFTGNPVWGTSNFQYSIRGLLARTVVDTTGDEPEWEWVFGSWDNENITAHQLSANAIANIRDNNQTLSLTAVIPPMDSSVAANATLRAGISETNFRGRILRPMDEEERLIEPVQITETLSFSSRSNFSQNIVYDPELSEFTTFTSRFSHYGFSASFSATHTEPWRYNYLGSVNIAEPDGWVQLGERSFSPQDLSFTYNRTLSQNNLWDGRMAFSFNFATGLAFDLQRYTNTRFNLALSANLGITNFLTLTAAYNTENAVMFRYFQNLPFFNLPTRLYPGQESNIFIDLFNSFRFDNTDLRRQSGFKMRGLNLSAIHHLGDWNARLTMELKPHLPAGATNYRFSTDISFLVQWVPVAELSTHIDYIGERLNIR